MTEMHTETGTQAGWFHAQGDPPGTVRRWNGSEWIGFAIPDPSMPASMHGSPATRTAPRPLSRSGAVLSVLAMTAMTALAVTFAVAAARIFQNLGLLRDATNDGVVGFAAASQVVVPVREVGEYIPNLGLLLILIVVMVVVSAAVFVPWLRAAGTAAQIKHLKGQFPVGKRRDVRPLTFFGRGSVFVAVLLPLFWALTEAIAGAAATPGRNRSLFGVVSDVATASSIDPQTGVAEIGPIKIMVWWALWWLPVLVAVPVWIGVWIAGPLQVATLATVLQLSAVLMILEAVSLLCIVATVAQITARLAR